ncbi:MAG: hypothetical protein AAB532_02755 [Patescibacteria group bacterium]
MSAERVEFLSQPVTTEAVLATKMDFSGTSFTLIKTSMSHMGGFYRTSTFRLETKPDKKPLDIDLSDNLTSMENDLTKQRQIAEKVQYLYASLAGVAGLGAVFALLASNLRDAPQMVLAVGLTATASLFYRKLDRALDISTKSSDKLNFLTRVRP